MRKSVALLSFLLSASSLLAVTSEISVDLKLDAYDFVCGERVRGVIDVASSSPDKVSVGYSNSRDSLFVEVFRASDRSQLTKVSKRAFVAQFRVDSGEGQKLETILNDHYALQNPSRYLAKPVLVHNGVRYEGQPRAFDIVEGVRVGTALQMFANHKDLQREFELVYWSKNHGEHLYLKARDAGSSDRRWQTRDLGPILRIDKPSVSILPSGEVIVLHRLNQDQFVRSAFWSLPNAFEFRSRVAVADPETAGTARVRELYKGKNVEAKENPWWKFW